MLHHASPDSVLSASALEHGRINLIARVRYALRELDRYGVPLQEREKRFDDAFQATADVGMYNRRFPDRAISVQETLR